jgi:undecaprenyl diphosphate synthase
MDFNRLPKHIAIIMDGNGRWAKERGLPRAEGHRRGSETIETIVETCREIGVRYLTLYAFSEENWSRPEGEVKALMKLLHSYLISKKQKMINEGIRFNVIGDTKLLSQELQQEIANTKEATGRGDKMTLTVALSYGSRQEICRAVNKIRSDKNEEITVEKVSAMLDTADIPDPDLLIRTSGEYRISNFLLWQLAYAELYFTEVLWPDFNKDEIVKAIEEYQRRERRFGLTSEQLDD